MIEHFHAIQRASCIFLLSLCISFTSFSQDYLFTTKIINTKDGLSSLTVKSIYKDQEGFLWVGTNYGLDRYDGYTFKHYTKQKNGIIDNLPLTKIVEDEDGKLWLYYRANTSTSDFSLLLNIFDPISEQLIPLEDYFTNPPPFDLKTISFPNVKDPKNRLWVCSSNNTLFLYEQKKFKKVYELLDETFSSFGAITVDHKDGILLNLGNRLLHTSIDGKLLNEFNSLNQIAGVWVDTDETIWICERILRDDLFVYVISYKEKNAPQFKELVPKHDNNIISLNLAIPEFFHRDQNGYWYFLHGEELVQLSKKGKLDRKISTYIDAIQFEYEDENSIWCSSAEGIVQIQKRKAPFSLIHHRGQKLSNCRGITEDINGDIYFFNNRTYKYTADSIIEIPTLPSIYYHSLLYKDRILYGGSYTMLEKDNVYDSGVKKGNYSGYQVDLSSKKIIAYPRKVDFTIYCWSEMNASDRVLVGTNKGLGELDSQNERINLWTFQADSSRSTLLSKSIVKHIYQNSSGIWLATDRGIFLVSKNQEILQYFSAPESMPFGDIQHFHEDEQGIFWLATKGGGLVKWQPNIQNPKTSTSKQFTISNGLSNDYLYAVYEDDYKRLWMSSDKGLMSLDKETEQVKIYLKEDGLLHNEFNFSSHYQAKNGTLYFGGLGGLISFHPATIPKILRSQIPLVVTNYRLLEGDAEKMTDKTEAFRKSNRIAIKPSDKLFELQFALLDYNDPEEHRYAYQIEGYTKNWQQIEQNFIRLTNLPYGRYTLNIKGKHNREGWSNQELSIPIHILRPFYLQWWFITIVLLSSIGTIIAIVRRRELSLKKNQERLEQEVKQRTQKIEEDKATIEAQAAALQQLDKAKTRFFSNITHEFRTPLTLIIGPLEQIIESQPPPNIFKRRIKGVIKNARLLLTLINQMLDLSKIESGQMRTEVTRGDLVEYTKTLTQQFDVLFERKAHRFSFVSNATYWETNFDKDKWNKIIYNLLSNAIKFTPDGQTIQLGLFKTTHQGQETIRLDVKDTGLGIRQEQINKIFNRFYQVDNSSRRTAGGTGIGLALVKELVELQGGKIWVHSQLEQGTTFELYIPVLQSTSAQQSTLAPAHLVTPMLPIIDSHETGSVEQTFVLKQQTTEKLDILLIEDNDEIREYIRYCLGADKYNVTEAANGEEGLLKAQSIVPDLIISDVMMPKRDGFEVVQEIRQNLVTSHIPVILLTAKASLESRLVGLKRGADAYLTKPFSPQELALRIEKLIELRQLLQKRYQNKIPSNRDVSYQKEDQFITDLRNYILERLDETKLNGESIGKYLGMSRVHLYRKLKALTNQSVSEFIKQIRLERAKELLLAGELNVSEIAYQTGFSSISYFSRSFKKAYGKAPSEM